MPFKLSNLNSNLALTLGYLNPALNNSALEFSFVFNAGYARIKDKYKREPRDNGEGADGG